MRALVIGGTGPTGIPLVRGLVDRGFDVTIVHRGLARAGGDAGRGGARPRRPVRRRRAARPCFADRTFDVVVAMYGRLRRIAELTAGRVGQFVSVGGVPAYRGWMNPWLYDPAGLPVPVAESAPTVDRPDDDEKGYRIVRTEQAVFAHHPARRALPLPVRLRAVPTRAARVARRAPDPRRPRPHRGRRRRARRCTITATPRTSRTRCCSAIEQPDAAAGKIFNVGDEEVLSDPPGHRGDRGRARSPPRHRVDAVRDRASRPDPLLAQPLPTHRVLDLGRVRSDLGYRDVAARARRGRRDRALARRTSVRTRAVRRRSCSPTRSTTPPRTGSSTRGPTAVRTLPDPGFATVPGFGLAYSGPGGRPRSNEEFDA